MAGQAHGQWWLELDVVLGPEAKNEDSNLTRGVVSVNFFDMHRNIGTHDMYHVQCMFNTTTCVCVFFF